LAAAGALSVGFGLNSLLRTLFPIHGITNYREAHCGLLSSQFLYFREARVGWYLGTVTGFWILGSLCLVTNGVFAAIDLWRTDDSSAEFILTCALLQMALSFLMFGSMFSTMYYFYILLSGILVIIYKQRHLFVTYAMTAGLAGCLRRHCE
jgi:hypothetical protein